jgi:hypothetical protein
MRVPASGLSETQALHKHMSWTKSCQVLNLEFERFPGQHLRPLKNSQVFSATARSQSSSLLCKATVLGYVEDTPINPAISVEGHSANPQCIEYSLVVSYMQRYDSY